MKKKIYLLMMLCGISFIESCTKLEEQILDETTTSTLNQKQAADGIIAPVYARLPDLFNHTNLFAAQEISTDEAILPYRGGTDWGDNGIYISMHQHTYQSTDPNLRSIWLLIQQGMSRAITAMNTLPTNSDPSAKTYLAEARGMRAYYSMMTLDLFGLVFVKEDVGETSTIIRGEDAFQYVKNEFLAIEPNLDNTVGPGRLTKSAVWGLLARLYLNAGVHRDIYSDKVNFKSEDMDKAVEYCDKIINGGQFQLSKDYFSIFGSDNHSNKELIFAIDQRAELNGNNRLAYFSLSGDQFPLTEFPVANGTDGPAITSDFYRTWVNQYAPIDPANADPRFYKQNMSIYSNPSDSCVSATDYNINRGILRGQQYGLIRRNGIFLKCRDGKNYKIGKLFNDSRNKPTLPVEFTEQVDFTTAGSNYSTGFRVEKYEFSKKSASGRNFGDADIVILRLADIYMMRAEAKMRKSNDVSSALADVNLVRASRTNPAPMLKEMSLDILFKERGFEFYWEHQRRTDMIRFGKYEGTWTEKNSTDKFKRIFPIPQTAIDGASNLPGYLKQNQSY